MARAQDSDDMVLARGSPQGRLQVHTADDGMRPLERFDMFATATATVVAVEPRSPNGPLLREGG